MEFGAQQNPRDYYILPADMFPVFNSTFPHPRYSIMNRMHGANRAADREHIHKLVPTANNVLAQNERASQMHSPSSTFLTANLLPTKRSTKTLLEPRVLRNISEAPFLKKESTADEATLNSILVCTGRGHQIEPKPHIYPTPEIPIYR